MSHCSNCGFNLDRKDEFEDDEPAVDAADTKVAPVAASGGAQADAEGSSGQSSSPSPSEKSSGEPTAAPKKRLSWDDTFRQIRKGKRV